MIEHDAFARQRQASLHDVLATTAEESKSRAELAIGNSVQRRQAHYMRELLFVANTLATKWGVDPQQIPTHRIFETRVVYTRKVNPKVKPSTVEQIPHQRQPLDRSSDSDTLSLEQHEKADHDEKRASETDATTQPNQQDLLPQVVLINGKSPEAEALMRMPSVGRAVARLLTQHKITYRVIAAHIDVSQSTIEKSVRGLRQFKSGMIHDICDFLGFSENDDRRETLIKMLLVEERNKRKLRQSRKQTNNTVNA